MSQNSQKAALSVYDSAIRPVAAAPPTGSTAKSFDQIAWGENHGFDDVRLSG
jgi:hypothetical protein